MAGRITADCIELGPTVLTLRHSGVPNPIDPCYGRLGTGFDKDSIAYISFKSRYDAGTTELVFTYDNAYFAESAMLANPDADPPLLPPLRWMLEQHPFYPRDPRDTINVAGFDNLPAPGQVDTVYIVTEGERQFQMVWNPTTTRYEPTTGDSPEFQRSTYSLLVGTTESPVAYTIRDLTGAEAGTPLDTPVKMAFAPQTNPVIPREDIDLENSDKELHIKADTRVEMEWNVRVGWPLGAASAVYWDAVNSAVVETTATHALGIIRLVKETAAGVQTVLDHGTFGLTDLTDQSQYQLTRSIVTEDLEDGDFLFVDVNGSSTSVYGAPMAKEVKVFGGYVRMQRYGTQAAAAIVREARRGIPVVSDLTVDLLGLITGVDFSTPIRLADTPIAHFYLRWQRADKWARQYIGEWDMRKLRIHETGANSFAELSAGDYTHHDARLWIQYKNDTPGRPYIYQGDPWDGWWQDALYQLKMSFYGASGMVEGFYFDGHQANSDMTVRIDIEFGRR